ncbi:MAG: 5,6-dimethylbenzimidazole synthase [Campylobacterales bacterium]|nr:5,6-dimethylbenzimidazole synthase [Campylobacterales bacterium]
MLDANEFLEFLKSRRDVRRYDFLDKPIEGDKLQMILKAAISAPSVGYSQPWKFVIIEDENIKNEIYKNFEVENEKAKKIFAKSELYKNLKLEGIKESPLNIAVLYEESDEAVLGMTSMKNMGEYSVVCAVQNMWLMARTLGIALGWVSILDEEKLLESIKADKKDKLIAYLCLGYVERFKDEPELKTLNWRDEKSLDECVRYIR